MELYEAIYRDSNFTYAQQTLESMYHTVQEYGLEGVSICFNGGKDCTVQLHLLVAVLAKYCRDMEINMNGEVVPIPVVYFKVDREFEELDEFNRNIAELYSFRLVEFDGRDMKQCLTNMQTQYPRMRAIFMGQRLGDPGSAYLKEVQVSDPGWPPVTRVNPQQRWSCAQVWQFLIGFRLPYCKQYELGYTSLGDAEHTWPNPHQQKTLVTQPSQERVCVGRFTKSGQSGQAALEHQYEGVQKAISFVTETQNYVSRCCEHTIFQAQPPPPPSPHVAEESEYNRNTEHGSMQIHIHVQGKGTPSICLCTWPYYPAYMLKDGTKEREGRCKKISKA